MEEDAQRTWSFAEQNGDDPEFHTLGSDISLLLDQININGHLSSEVAKLRGLKQGDLLSLILYNLAFEPFLLSVMSDRHIQGYSMGIEQIKLLCYTDGVLVFLHDAADFSRLQLHMHRVFLRLW
ncbi:hypothetical protein [Parasitella parasitica]|uniref:Reverse transcriptase domain-containing protein n=1 Tax=Parasitella parasitica TaxID=35722 RepID=A0A0B7N847_9FUNG|nr:hypothetical protein [Parasitella parasitica]